MYISLRNDIKMDKIIYTIQGNQNDEPTSVSNSDVESVPGAVASHIRDRRAILQ